MGLIVIKQKIKKLKLPLSKMTGNEKDYTAVLLEDVNSNIKAFWEVLSGVKEKGDATFEQVGLMTEKIDGIEIRLDSIEGQQTETNKRLDSIEGQQTETNKRLDSIEFKLDDLMKEVSSIKEEIKDEGDEGEEEGRRDGQVQGPGAHGVYGHAQQLHQAGDGEHRGHAPSARLVGMQAVLHLGVGGVQAREAPGADGG